MVFEQVLLDSEILTRIWPDCAWLKTFRLGRCETLCAFNCIGTTRSKAGGATGFKLTEVNASADAARRARDAGVRHAAGRAARHGGQPRRAPRGRLAALYVGLQLKCRAREKRYFHS